MTPTPHALLAREIVTALLKLPRDEQREFMREAVEFLRRESFTEVNSIYEFLMAEPTAILTDARRIELLATVARSAKAHDLSLIQNTKVSHDGAQPRRCV